MLKRFTLNDVLNFAYYAAISFVLASVLEFVLFNGVELYLHFTGLNRENQINTWADFITLYSLSFVYLIWFHPLKQKVPLVTEQQQDPEFLSLPEEVTQVYLLAELLSSPMCYITSSARGSINSYLTTFLEDDSLFEDLPTPDTLSLLHNVLKAGHLNSENQYLANNRLVKLVTELKALDIKNN